MEFHPSHARVVVSEDPLPATLDRIVVHEARAANPPAHAIDRRAPLPCGAPRLIDLERRAKFAATGFVTA